MHAAIGQDLDASEDDTMSVWEALAAMKQGLLGVTGEADANSEFLIQARNSLSNLIINLEKLSHHYRENMPKINKVLQKSKARL
jgi:ABC-type transporter Mla subunit MlaD